MSLKKDIFQKVKKVMTDTSLTDWLTVCFSAAGFVVSVIAIVISINTNKSTDQQFFFLNQGYLHVEPQYAMNRDQKSMMDEIVPDDEDTFRGITFFVDVVNLGNLPVNFQVITWNIYIDKVKIHVPDKAPVPMPLYPKQKTQIFLPTFYFTTSGFPAATPQALVGIPFKDVKKKYFRFELVIEYSDFGVDHKKTIDREYEIRVMNGGGSTGYLRYGDTI